MKKNRLSLLFILTLIQNTTCVGQQLVYSDIFNGGVTGAGYTVIGTGSVEIKIPNGSSIKKAFFFCGNRMSFLPEITVQLDDLYLQFNSSTAVSTIQNSENLDNHAVTHLVDITNQLNIISDTLFFYAPLPTLSNVYPFGNIIYTDYFLIVIYENPSMPKTAFNIHVMDQAVDSNIIYNYQTMPFDTTKPIAISLLTGHMVNTIYDGSYVYLNDTIELGLIGGQEQGMANNAGVFGNFYYQNDSLFGLRDDTPDSLMGGGDALADISSYLQNNDNNFELSFRYQGPITTANDGTSNPVWATFLTYSTPCDTFSTSINIPDTTICYGESLVLRANGGATYKWEVFGNVVGYGDSLAITPDSSLYYIVKITDSNGCMKTEMAHIVVNSPLQIGNVVVSPTLCGSATGNIAVENVSGGTVISGGAYIYSINGTQNTNISIYYNEFNNLQEGSYNVQVTDFYGCTVNDSITVSSYINTTAQFSASSQSGEAPLTVAFTNQSSNANSYAWYINNEESVAFAGESYTFDSVGVYEVTLYAYGNDTTCVDSASVLINVVSPFRVFIPTFYDASLGSLFLDVRGCKTVTLEIFDEIGKLIYVEKKTVTDGQNEFWKGYNARGIYLYRIFAEGTDGTKLEQGGKLVLMK